MSLLSMNLLLSLMTERVALIGLTSILQHDPHRHVSIWTWQQWSIALRILAYLIAERISHWLQHCCTRSHRPLAANRGNVEPVNIH